METKKTIVRVLRSTGKFISDLFDLYLFLQIQFDRKVIKRYLGIETPLYKIWWRDNVKRTQRRLDRNAMMREPYIYFPETF